MSATHLNATIADLEDRIRQRDLEIKRLKDALAFERSRRWGRDMDYVEHILKDVANGHSCEESELAACKARLK